ncbi:MAG: hypothetical protein BGO49_25945 [Planctomycetales bacterium 71-10]|nr:MAG: hypothetical protein BGO49_25945 [Planctomycetales bacterium 71-10]
MSTTSARALGLASSAPSALAVAAGALASFGAAGLMIGARAGVMLLLASAACAALAWRLSKPAPVDRIGDRVARASRAAVHAFKTPSGPVPPIRFLDERREVANRLRRASDAGRTRLAAALHRAAYVVAPTRD